MSDCCKQLDPDGWINKALAFDDKNMYFRAVLVGMGTIILLRSKLLDIDGTKVGPEYVYELFRNWAVNGYKVTASVQKMRISRALGVASTNVPSFEDDIIKMVRDSTDHLPSSVRRQLDSEIASAMALKQSDQIRYHDILVRIAIDFTSIRAIRKWAKSRSISIERSPS